MLDVLILALALSAAPYTPPHFEPRPCAGDLARTPARCGVVEVPEDRSRPGGRSIGLNVVVLPATGTTRDLPALVDIDGGPGLPSTRSAGFYLSDGSAYRARRDVVLVDQRGTGGSNLLSCPELPAADAVLQEMYPPPLVARCRRALESKADLVRYGTADAVEDLEAVRAALGHEQIDIVALSYGTTMAMRYMATYPTRVRAAVLMGVVPAVARPPQDHAPAAQRALEQVWQVCAANPACHAAFPAPRTDLDRALSRLRAGRGASAPVFMEKIRTLLYQPATARRVPYIVHRAAEGDLAPFHAAVRPRGPPLLADGVYLTITCAESFALMDYAKAARAARATRFGDYRLRRQRQACRRWPTARVAAGHLRPVAPSAAVLLISGGLDPVTPPDWAEAAARRMPNARHLLIPESGHVFDGLSDIDTCYDPMVVAFLERAEPQAVDASCLARMVPPPFTVGPS